MSLECFFFLSHTNLVLSVFTTSPERQPYISNVFSATRRESLLPSRNIVASSANWLIL